MKNREVPAKRNTIIRKPEQKFTLVADSNVLPLNEDQVDITGKQFVKLSKPKKRRRISKGKF